MGKDSQWYDDVYLHSEEAVKQPEDSMYIDVWKIALKYITKANTVADFGCGPGQFAKFLVNNGRKFIYGVDFSMEAIKMAYRMNPMERFYIGDLINPRYFSLHQYDTAICFKVLEHIKKDIAVVSNIPKDKKVLFSVPNFPYKSHVRHFKHKDDVYNRYAPYFNIIEIIPIDMNRGNVIYLTIAIKK